MSKVDLTAQRLRELLHYDPETGVFTWRISRGPKAPTGAIAGGIHKARGYWRIRLDDDLYYGHQLAWLHVHGEWPAHSIDHLDGNRTNNRIVNLRDVSNRINSQNRRRATPNTRSGFLGVAPNGSGWMALIKCNGKTNYLGTFRKAEDAHAAYVEAKRALHAGNTL